MAERPLAGRRYRRRRPAAVPLPPRLAHPAGRREVPEDAHLRKALSKAREQVLIDLGARGDDAGACVRGRRTAARPRVLPDRQRRLRRGEQQLRSDHPRAAARPAGGERRWSSTSWGKSGIEHRITIDDPGAVEALEVMRRRRGGDDRLLAWKDGRTWRPVDSSLVNEYVGSGRRAWRPRPRTSVPGTRPRSSRRPRWSSAGEPAQPRPRASGPSSAAMKEVSESSATRPTLARSAYVDPRVVDAFEEGRTIESVTRRTYKTADGAGRRRSSARCCAC